MLSDGRTHKRRIRIGEMGDEECRAEAERTRIAHEVALRVVAQITARGPSGHVGEEGFRGPPNGPRLDEGGSNLMGRSGIRWADDQGKCDQS